MAEPREASSAAIDQSLVRVALAADAFTRYPEDRDAFDELCSSCEAIEDDEWDAVRDA